MEKPPAAKNPAGLLREHGLPVTAQRLAILRAASGKPYGTANTIAEHVRAEIGTISRQAVYDSLGIDARNLVLLKIETPKSRMTGGTLGFGGIGGIHGGYH